MTTKTWAIGLMVLCTVFTSFAQILYKMGADKLEFNLISLITNVPLISGMALYVLGAIIMITAFKGGEVSVLYPIIATSYIWVSLLSMYVFKESLNLFRWAGILIIIIGIIFINIGSKEKESMKYTDVI
ncbi:MAG: EamA family transporter [Nanoarchaeota archaeon]|nr:EamA family transporter [Nanoarchaeota archaeon]MBU1004298.1 EamA family transporter [Nanoarchaeota archaeon]MBU1945484.1 EamA family transporter [Nanoarchaeota archaeon]